MFPVTTPAARRRAPFFALAFAAALVAFVAVAPSAVAATLTVTITGVHSARGDVYVALFNRAENFPDGDYSVRHLKVRASTKPIVVSFNDIPPGTYAVGCYHDEGKLGHFKTNWFGYPLDGYALSNGIRAVVSRPTFAQAAFPISNPATFVTLNVRY